MVAIVIVATAFIIIRFFCFYYWSPGTNFPSSIWWMAYSIADDDAMLHHFYDIISTWRPFQASLSSACLILLPPHSFSELSLGALGPSHFYGNSESLCFVPPSLSLSFCGPFLPCPYMFPSQGGFPHGGSMAARVQCVINNKRECLVWLVWG